MRSCAGIRDHDELDGEEAGRGGAGARLGGSEGGSDDGGGGGGIEGALTAALGGAVVGKDDHPPLRKPELELDDEFIFRGTGSGGGGGALNGGGAGAGVSGPAAVVVCQRGALGAAGAETAAQPLAPPALRTGAGGGTAAATAAQPPPTFFSALLPAPADAEAGAVEGVVSFTPAAFASLRSSFSSRLRSFSFRRSASAAPPAFMG